MTPLEDALEYFALSLRPDSKQLHLKTVIAAAQELLDLTALLSRVDSVTSLAAWRYASGVPADVIDELKDVSQVARRKLKTLT